VDVRQLAALVAIADHGTFSAAARALFTVQSNVSTRISRLERELGTTLVDRAHGTLTEDGQRVVERARRILRELDEIAADVTPVDGQVAGDVHIGLLGTTARWLLPHLLATLDTRYPNVRAIISEGSTSVLIPAVLTGRLRAAVIHLPVEEPELVIDPLFAEDLVVVAPAGHPLAEHTELPLADVATAGVQLRVHAEIDGVRLLASLAADGHGAAIVPATAVPQSATSRFAVVRVPELPQRVVALAHQRRPSPSAPTRAVFDVLRDVVADQARQQRGVRVGTQAFPLSRAI
jgi:DNA-binding transcriptional LysR family regulator